MHATIKITMDNAAFEAPNTELELAGILRDLAEKVEAGDRERNLRDTNGNTVGTFKIVGQPRRFPR
jgi:hypothetical protein